MQLDELFINEYTKMVDIIFIFTYIQEGWLCIFQSHFPVRVLVCAQLSPVKWVPCKAKLSQTHPISARAQIWLCKQEAQHVCTMPTNPDSLKLCRHSCFHFSCHPCSVAWQSTNVFKYNCSLPSFLQNCNFGNCLSKWIFFPPCFHYTGIVLTE